MRRLAVACTALILVVAEARAQPSAPDVLAQRAAIGKLDWLVGQWEGEGWTYLPTGQRVTFKQTEAIETRLSGGIMIIEGKGFAAAETGAPEAALFNAFAVLSYDDQAKRYAFRSYAQGYAATMDAEVRDDGTLIWSMRPPGQIIRYTIVRADARTWKEVGERSVDNGKTWVQFFEMTLKKKG